MINALFVVVVKDAAKSLFGVFVARDPELLVRKLLVPFGISFHDLGHLDGAGQFSARAHDPHRYQSRRGGVGGRGCAKGGGKAPEKFAHKSRGGYEQGAAAESAKKISTIHKYSTVEPVPRYTPDSRYQTLKRRFYSKLYGDFSTAFSFVRLARAAVSLGLMSKACS